MVYVHVSNIKNKKKKDKDNDRKTLMETVCSMLTSIVDFCKIICVAIQKCYLSVIKVLTKILQKEGIWITYQKLYHCHSSHRRKAESPKI